MAPMQLEVSLILITGVRYRNEASEQCHYTTRISNGCSWFMVGTNYFHTDEVEPDT